MLAALAAFPSAHAVTSCNCVVFRLDDIQDSWIRDVQLTVLDSFIDSSTPLMPGIEMNFYGSDSAVVNKISEGYNADLFELALHGWNHVSYNELSLSEQTSTLQLANEKLQTIHDTESKIFIPPYNQINPDTLAAMDAVDLEILSADLFPDGSIEFLPLTYPPRDFSGIVSLPYTVNFIDDEKPKGSNGKSVSALKTEIDSSIAVRGWAVVMLHPDDLAVFSAGVEQNVVNATQIDTLEGLVEQLNTDGRVITSYNNLVALIGDTSMPVDTIRPTGSIVAPASGSGVTIGVPFVVSGTAFDNVGLSKVEVRATLQDESDGTAYGLATTSDGFSNWQHNLTISNPNFTKIVVRVTDKAGNQQWLSSTVQPNGPVADTVKPAVTISSPSSGQQITLGSTIVVTGAATDNVALSKVEIKAAREDETSGTAYSQASLNNGLWSFALLMSNPDYSKIVARATDTSGNQQWSKISIAFATGTDIIKPGATITSPTSDQQVTGGAALLVSGTASDNVALSKVEVRATLPDETDGTSYMQATLNNGSWSYNLPMTNTAYTKIVARATDTAGNQQWAKVSISFTAGPDTIKPIVAITSPTSGQSVSSGATITVTGSASDNVAMSKVEVRATLPDETDGTAYVQATLNEGFWNFSLPMTNPAFTEIVARATDTAGNQQWTKVSVAMSAGPDTIKPIVTITSPVASSSVSAGQIVVTGMTSDNAGIAFVEVRTDGGTYAQATPVAPEDWSSWSMTLTVASGERDIVAHAVDTASNPQWYHVIVNAS